MIAPPDYYQILSLQRNCSESDVRLAYRKLALKHHPERNNTPGTKEKFTSIAEAFDVLSDVKRRAIYDQYGTKGLRNGVLSREDFDGFPGGYSFHQDGELVFNQFFGTKNPFADFFVGQVDINAKKFGAKFGGLQGLANSGKIFEPTQDKPVEYDLVLSLEDLYTGTLKKIKVSRKVLNDDGMSTSSLEKILTIKVAPGWKHGTKIIFSKEGDQGPNKIPADVIFTVKEAKHDLFTREGNNLKIHSQVPLVKALVGYSMEVKTLDGRILRIPINDTITPEYVKVVKNEGMPDSKTEIKGDLLITFNTSFPQALTTQQKSLLLEAFRK